MLLLHVPLPATAFVQLDGGEALWQNPSGAQLQAGCRADLQGGDGAGDETRTRDSLLGRCPGLSAVPSPVDVFHKNVQLGCR